jgi:CRP/FNR family transcriptional regulator, anaerobic regulatory protein
VASSPYYSKTLYCPYSIEKGIEMFATEREYQFRPSNVTPFAAATTPTLASVFRNQPTEVIQAGSALFWEGDPAKHLFEVVEGVLRIFRIIGDGRRVITGFLFPGDLVGISMKDRYLYGAEAVTVTRVRRFARSAFQEKMNQCPALRPKLFARLCDEMAAAQDQMALLACKTAEERLCSFLLLLARRTGDVSKSTATVELPMTRQDIADYLGLTIETVSRNMTKLTARGMIVPKGRHGYQFKTDRLSLLAGDEDADNNGCDDSDTVGRQRFGCA